MLAKYGLEALRPEVIDSSMLRDFVDCPSLFYLKHVLGLRKRYRDPTSSGNLDWGSCWHEVMFAFMEAKDLGLDDRIVKGLQAIEEHYPAYLTPDNDKVKRSKERMVEQFFAYVKIWMRMEGEYEILRNEQYFDVYEPRINLRWCGRIDSIRRVLRNKKIRIWDYKTTKQMGDHFFDQFEVGFQFPGYVWAGSRLLTDEVNEITVDLMYTVTPGSKVCPGGFDFFHRTFRYDEHRLAEWERNVKMWVDRIMYLLDNHLYEPEMWSKNWNQCNRYGQCSFFSVHSMNPVGEGRLLTLRDDYIVERWDPSARAGEDYDT